MSFGLLAAFCLVVAATCYLQMGKLHALFEERAVGRLAPAPSAASVGELAREHSLMRRDFVANLVAGALSALAAIASLRRRWPWPVLGYVALAAVVVAYLVVSGGGEVTTIETIVKGVLIVAAGWATWRTNAT